MTDAALPVVRIEPLPPLAIEPAPEDFSLRAVRIQLVLSRVRDFLTSTVADALANDPSGTIADAELLDTIDAHLADLSGEVAGAFNQVTERLIDARYDGCAPGPFYRRRRA
jgi:hypothetical protein